jgi:hypothetical protein
LDFVVLRLIEMFFLFFFWKAFKLLVDLLNFLRECILYIVFTARLNYSCCLVMILVMFSLLLGNTLIRQHNLSNWAGRSQTSLSLV